MSTASSVIADVSRLAVGQWGLITTAQARREGITRLQLARLADAKVLTRVDRGVYAATSASDEHRTLRAAWLTLDPLRTAEERLSDIPTTGVVSHTSAAGLYELGDLLDDRPEFTLPQRKQTHRDIRLHRRTLSTDQVTSVDGLPTTTVERTVADLLTDGHDREHVAKIMGEAVRREMVDLNKLAVQIGPSARRHGQADGSALVEHLLDLVGLSPAAIARDLARTPTGQGLFDAGRTSALNEVLTSMIPDIGSATTLTPGRLGLYKIFLDLQHSGFSAEDLTELTLANATAPSVRTALAQMRSPALKGAFHGDDA